MRHAAMIATLMVFALSVAGAPAGAQGTAQEKVAAQCKNEIAQFCQDKSQGEALRTCLDYHLDVISDHCKTAFKAMKSAEKTAHMGHSAPMEHSEHMGGQDGGMGSMQ